MKRLSIYYFTVNEGMGPNLAAQRGGGETCCVSIPRKWRPGIKLKIKWEYDKRSEDSTPLPPAQAVEVDLPKYEKPGKMQVHFYDDHKVKVVVSNCSPEHPFYPMAAGDIAPWVPFRTKEEMREVAKQGGGTVDC